VKRWRKPPRASLRRFTMKSAACYCYRASPLPPPPPRPPSRRG
jgi:hypothetical protein